MISVKLLEVADAAAACAVEADMLTAGAVWLFDTTFTRKCVVCTLRPPVQGCCVVCRWNVLCCEFRVSSVSFTPYFGCAELPIGNTMSS